MPKDKLPHFNNAMEAGEFWDTHSTADYPEAFEEVQVEFARPLRVRIELAFEISSEESKQLRELSRARGMSPESLAKEWFLKMLHDETAAEQPVRDVITAKRERHRKQPQNQPSAKKTA